MLFTSLDSDLTVLNKGEPPTEYQLHEANHGPSWKQATGLELPYK